jgi:hypothetical protein
MIDRFGGDALGSIRRFHPSTSFFIRGSALPSVGPFCHPWVDLDRSARCLRYGASEVPVLHSTLPASGPPPMMAHGWQSRPTDTAQPCRSCPCRVIGLLGSGRKIDGKKMAEGGRIGAGMAILFFCPPFFCQLELRASFLHLVGGLDRLASKNCGLAARGIVSNRASFPGTQCFPGVPVACPHSLPQPMLAKFRRGQRAHPALPSIPTTGSPTIWTPSYALSNPTSPDVLVPRRSCRARCWTTATAGNLIPKNAHSA